MSTKIDEFTTLAGAKPPVISDTHVDLVEVGGTYENVITISTEEGTKITNVSLSENPYSLSLIDNSDGTYTVEGNDLASLEPGTEVSYQITVKYTLDGVAGEPIVNDYSFTYGQPPVEISNDALISSFDSVSINAVDNGDETVTYTYDATLNTDLTTVIDTLTITLDGKGGDTTESVIFEEPADNQLEVAGDKFVKGDVNLGNITLDAALTDITASYEITLQSGNVFVEGEDGALDLGETLTTFTQDEALAGITTGDDGTHTDKDGNNLPWIIADGIIAAGAIVVAVLVIANRKKLKL